MFVCVASSCSGCLLCFLCLSCGLSSGTGSGDNNPHLPMRSDIDANVYMVLDVCECLICLGRQTVPASYVNFGTAIVILTTGSIYMSFTSNRQTSMIFKPYVQIYYLYLIVIHA